MKIELSVKDKTAQDLLWEYAQRRRAVDAEFAADLEAALVSAGHEPAAFYANVAPPPPTPIDLVLMCAHCAARPAVCVGNYGEPGQACAAACNECCGHGDEDGWCVLLVDVPAMITTDMATLARVRAELGRIALPFGSASLGRSPELDQLKKGSP